MNEPFNVLEELQAAYAIVAEALDRAPQLHQSHLDLALLFLALSIKRAKRSSRLRPARRYPEHNLPF